MIIDATMFFQEFDMLEFRMKLLWDYVDKFVIVEADRTHSGIKRLFHLDKEDARFRWASKKMEIFHLEVPSSFLEKEIFKSIMVKPSKYDPEHYCWKIENFQREAIMTACNKYSDKDTLIMGDVDEIPSYEALSAMSHPSLPMPIALQQRIVPLDLTNLDPAIGWRGTVFSKLGFARETGIQALRNMRKELPFIEKGGWHLSYFGGAQQIKTKIESFAHQELNSPILNNINHIESCIDSGQDIFGYENKNVKIGKEFYPGYFIKHAPKKWWGEKNATI